MVALLETLRKEWHVIKGAPFSFAIVCLVVVGAFFGGFKWYYAEKVRDANARADQWKGDVDYWKDLANRKTSQSESLPTGTVQTAPKPHETMKVAPGRITVQSGAHVEGTANSPDSMAVGINTGTMIQGEAHPTFIQTVGKRNSPVSGGYETTFDVEITANHAFAMTVSARGTSISKLFSITQELPPGSGGTAIMIMNSQSGPTFTAGSVQTVTSGKWIISVETAQPDNVSLKLSD